MSKRRSIGIGARRVVAERANWRCEYCQSPEKLAPQPFTMEHIIPANQGGSDEIDNLAYACQGCNSIKYTKTVAIDPVTKLPATLFNPRTESWHDHFIWDAAFTQIIGISPAGRATVVALKLNRKKLIALREILVLFGKHPPV